MRRLVGIGNARVKAGKGVDHGGGERLLPADISVECNRSEGVERVKSEGVSVRADT